MRTLLFLGALLGCGQAQLMPNALPGGPAVHDQSYNVFLKQATNEEDHKALLSAGHPLPLDPAASLWRLYASLLDLPSSLHEGLLSAATAAQDSQLRRLWVHAFFASLTMVACGVLPALFMPRDAGLMLKDPRAPARRNLNRALAFSVGSLLGDVFLHLLPETYGRADKTSAGLWILAGIVFCLLLEKLLATTEEDKRRVAAFLNLAANVVDNASHGLAIGGSFLVSAKFGWLTTAAILLHEIPHELSDFAILLRGDFTRWSAVKAQVVTSSGSVIGALLALGAGLDGAAGAAWILPFTAGGFLNIALVQLLPDLMKERERREAVIQLGLILGGIGVMQIMNSAIMFV